jgi:dihydroneopterin aldolase
LGRALVSDRIALRDIRAYGKHGANPGERDHVQPFDLDLEIDVNLTAARRSDALPDTIDYAALHGRIVRLVETLSFALLERLGEAILLDVMLDERIGAARVTIAKPALLAGATPSVLLRADRASHPIAKVRKRLPPSAAPRRRMVGDPRFDPKVAFLGAPAHAAPATGPENSKPKSKSKSKSESKPKADRKAKPKGR